MARFTRFTLSPPRSLGRRLRGAAVAALVVGAAGAFIPGSHVAHAAAMVGCTPAPIDSTIASSATVNTPLTSVGPLPAVVGTGALTIKVDGSTVTFFGSDQGALANQGLGGGVNGTPVFNALPVCPGSIFPPVGPGNVSGSLTVILPAAIAAVVGGNTATCNTTTVDSITFTAQNTKGADTVAVTCETGNGGSITIDLNLAANGIPIHTPPAATPELGSGELLATGLLPALGILLYRRRRQRRAAK